MSLRKPLIGLSIFLVLAMVVTWMVFVTLRRDVGGPTNTYSAMFTDVTGMNPGDDVRVAGVRVGRVDNVELAGTQAKVTFRVQGDQPIFTSTVASVTYQNIIGQRYLGLSAGTGDNDVLLPSGSTIPVERTNPSFDISYLLNGFEPLFTVLDPEQVDNLTNAIVQAFQGDTGSLLALITQTSAVAESFAGPDEVLGTLITNLNTVVSNLATQSNNLALSISQTRTIMAALQERRDALIGSMGSISSTVARLATITDAVTPEIQEFVGRQPGFAAHIGESPDRFAYMAANLPYLLKGLARTTQYGPYINLYVCNANVRFFAFMSRMLPAIVRLASPGNVVRNSAVCR